MAQNKSESILIRLTPGRLEAWEQAQEESNYSAMSEFVRHAVTNEIDGRHAVGDGSGSVDSEQLKEVVGDALEEHDSGVSQRLSSIEAAINGLQDEFDTGGGGTVAAELVFEGLPSVSPYKRDEGGEKQEKSHDELVAQAKSPEEVADTIGVPTDPVRRTLERLDLESERVLSVELSNGKRQYFANV